MRKVYQSEKSTRGLAVAVLMAVGLTGLLFATLPFTHMIAKPTRTLELRKTSAADLPPPVEPEAPPPPPEADKPPEAPPEPKLAEMPQQIPLTADLDVATGSGGALAGFGEVQAIAAKETAKEEAFDVSELDKRPEPVSQVQPAYPPELRKAKIEGKVTLLCFVTAEGRVEDARVGNSSRPEFEKPALEAIRKWRFRPGVKEGRPVGAYLSCPISFRVTSR